MSEQTKKRKSQTEKLKEELEIQKDLVLRTAAEFDNYKKRTESEKLRMLNIVKHSY